MFIIFSACTLFLHTHTHKLDRNGFKRSRGEMQTRRAVYTRRAASRHLIKSAQCQLLTYSPAFLPRHGHSNLAHARKFAFLTPRGAGNAAQLAQQTNSIKPEKKADSQGISYTKAVNQPGEKIHLARVLQRAGRAST